MKQNKVLQNSGWWIFAVLSLAPAVMWAFGAPLKLRFLNLASTATSIGEIFGLCGMAMFSLIIILSARLKIFEKVFKGINDSYAAHHYFGGIAFSLLLAHPLLLAYKYLLFSYSATALFLLPSSGNWPQNFGIFGLFVMIIALVITFYTKLKYQVWKFTHKFLGLAFLFAFFHVFFIGFDISANYVLKIYLFILAMLALSAYFYRALFGAYLVNKFDYKIKKIEIFPDKITELEFEPQGENLKFSAGQFAFVKFHSDISSSEAHPFSMSSAPKFPLKFAIKESGDWTNKIKSLKIGDDAKIEGPYGIFNFKNHSNKKQIWIAGGVGITPFMSMLRSLTDKDSDYKINLYYSVANENDIAFEDEIKKTSEVNKNLNATFWRSNISGFINVDAVRKSIPNIIEYDVLICGPGLMMEALKAQFLKAGLKENQIYSEDFQLY